MRNRARVLGLSILALSVPCLAQGPQTVLERLEERFDKNPELRKLNDSVPAPLQRVNWMVGRWDASEKTFATSRTPERTATGVRVTAFELGGRWLVSRNTLGEASTQTFLGYDAYQRRWAWQFFSSVGRGTNGLLFAASWDQNQLAFSGAMTFWGEGATIDLRIDKISDDEYTETFEETLGGGRVIRPIFQYKYVRQKAGPPPAKAPAK